MTADYNVPKRLKSADGTIKVIFKGKLHNWEGPAIIYPNGKEEYYINGIKYTLDDWKKAIKSQNGVPYYKQSGNNVRN